MNNRLYENNRFYENEVSVRGPSVGCLVIITLLSALCCYQTAKARTLCVC